MIDGTFSPKRVFFLIINQINDSRRTDNNCLFCIILNFFYIHKKKVLDSRKFSTFGLRCFEKSDWPVLENVCPSVGLSHLSICLYASKILWTLYSRTNERKLMKLYIQLHLYVVWSSLDFGVYRSRSSDVIRNFWFL